MKRSIEHRNLGAFQKFLTGKDALEIVGVMQRSNVAGMFDDHNHVFVDENRVGEGIAMHNAVGNSLHRKIVLLEILHDVFKCKIIACCIPIFCWRNFNQTTKKLFFSLLFLIQRKNCILNSGRSCIDR